MRSKLLFVLPLLTFLSCTHSVTPQSLMDKGAHRGTPKEGPAALELAEFAANSENDFGLRCWAIRALTRLQAAPPEAVHAIGKLLVNPRVKSKLRSWSAHALGEMRRKEAIPYFLEGLVTSPTDETAYFILEGLAKVVPVILQDSDLNTEVVEHMNRFAASRNREVPPIFDLLDAEITNLVVLAVTLEKMLTPEAAQPAVSENELYLGIYKALEFIHQAKEQFINSFARNQQGIERLFQLSYRAAGKSTRSILLLVLWYSGTLGDNRELANLCGAELVKWLSHSDPRVRQIVAWGLMRMQLYAPVAHKALVDSFLVEETDPGVLAILRHQWRSPDGPDALQRLLRVELGGDQ